MASAASSTREERWSLRSALETWALTVRRGRGSRPGGSRVARPLGHEPGDSELGLGQALPARPRAPPRAARPEPEPGRPQPRPSPVGVARRAPLPVEPERLRAERPSLAIAPRPRQGAGRALEREGELERAAAVSEHGHGLE